MPNLCNGGIAPGLARSAKAVGDDERVVLTLSALNRDLPEFAPVCFSLPRVLGAGGIVITLQPTLDAQVNAALQRSVGILSEVAATLPL